MQRRGPAEALLYRLGQLIEQAEASGLVPSAAIATARAQVAAAANEEAARTAAEEAARSAGDVRGRGG
jgi:outer membrane protein TolC|eukprot:COSAG01_NODE_6778_length_3502_cov_4.184837_4_plen_68_part_00